MAKKDVERLESEGEQIYDDFLKLIFQEEDRMKIKMPNPRTNTLELFGVLSERGEKEWLIGAMCAEVASSAENGELFAQNGGLYKRITTIQEV